MIKPTVVVYGSGVSGLIAAYFLYKKGFKVTVIDPYNKHKISTLIVSEGLVERAANSILCNQATKDLLNEIGLEYEFYSDLGKKKYVFINGKTKRWPLSFIQTLKNLKPLFALMKKNPQIKPLENETLKDWGLRVLREPLLDNLIVPGLQGIYGGDVKELSASLVLKNFFQLDRKDFLGSISFKNGMQEFCDYLKGYLIKKGASFEKESLKNYNFRVISTPTYSLPDCVSMDIKNILSKVSYKKISTMTVFMDKEDRVPFKGFGCVFKNQKKGVLGLILNSDIFTNRAKQGLVSETWIFNGCFIKEEKTALSLVKSFREEKFFRKNKIIRSYFKYWEQAFPAYDLTLEGVLKKIEKYKHEMYFFANWTGNLGIGSMIQNGEAFAKNILKKNKETKYV